MKLNSILPLMVACTLTVAGAGAQTKKNPIDSGNSNALRINLSSQDSSAATGANKDTKKVDKKDPNQQPNEGEMGGVLAMLIDNIKKASIDFQFDLTYSSSKKSNKTESYLDVNMLKLDAIIQFKDDLSYSPINPATADSQSKKLLPKMKLNTKNMFMVGNANVEKKSEFVIRFCNNYTLGNNFCDTLGDTKLLEFSIHNQTFNKILSLKLKEIRMNLEKKISENSDVYEITGSCISLKKAFDPEAVADVYVPVDCSFSGKFSPNPEIGTKINFKYKDKK